MPCLSPVSDGSSSIKILISTDNHLGYLEKDPIRGDDSFRVFEEVLQLAKANQVDMLLLGGDLFHHNKPSSYTLVKTMELLRNACLSQGDHIKLTPCNDSSVNYKNPNVSVSLPVFIIHGNHDDPIGAHAVSAIDILEKAGLVTYFGKMPCTNNIKLAPIHLQKGRAALALYGLGNIPDTTLFETINNGNVTWLRPGKTRSHRDKEHHSSAPNADGNDNLNWFNLFVIHQNRVTRGISQGIPESFLPPWLHYVVWGHEHDSIPALSRTSPPVSQPGSTVATSLTEGESKPKHAVLLEIFEEKGKFKHTPVPLYTVRKLHFSDVSVSNCKGSALDAGQDTTVAYLDRTVEQIRKKQEDDFKQQREKFRNNTFCPPNRLQYPPNKFYVDRLTDSVGLPLVRIRVEAAVYQELINSQRFGRRFINKIASPSEILRRRKSSVISNKFANGRYDLSSKGKGARTEDESISTLTQEYLSRENDKLHIFRFEEINKAISDFIDKDRSDAIQRCVSSCIENPREFSRPKVEMDTNQNSGKDRVGAHGDDMIVEAASSLNKNENRSIGRNYEDIEATPSLMSGMHSGDRNVTDSATDSNYDEVLDENSCCTPPLQPKKLFHDPGNDGGQKQVRSASGAQICKSREGGPANGDESFKTKTIRRGAVQSQTSPDETNSARKQLFGGSPQLVNNPMKANGREAERESRASSGNEPPKKKQKRYSNGNIRHYFKKKEPTQ